MVNLAWDQAFKKKYKKIFTINIELKKSFRKELAPLGGCRPVMARAGSTQPRNLSKIFVALEKILVNSLTPKTFFVALEKG